MKFSACACRRRTRRGACAVGMALGFAMNVSGVARADEAAASAPAVDRSEWESGWHVVRPGDTLEGLALRYLGASTHWRELHQLNPFVQDPDLLFPGQRLRIFLERPTARLSAQVMAVARDVRELPTPVPWRPANEGDVLLERDALRTAKSSSARLLFDDGATVTLSEDSLVFIRRQTAANAPVPKKEIEIEVGQIDVESAPVQSNATAEAGGSGPAGRRGGRGSDAIEVIVAGARSLATPSGGQPLSTRSRRESGDLAQFMVFSGKSTISAAGGSVEVPAGSGTSVAPKAKPGPVEELLPAPGGLRPAYGEEIEQGAPQFSWTAVPGAARYTVEVCRDPACGAVVARDPAVAAAPLELAVEGGLPAGELFWRVTAVAASGLDGYPSAAIRVQAVEAVRPNAPLLALRTASGETVVSGSCLPALPEPVVRALDRRGAELPWTLQVDGRETGLEAFRALPPAGRHEITARATDARGRSADSPAIAITLDAAAPWVDLVTTAAGPAASPEEEKASDRRKRSRRRTTEPPPVAVCDTGLEVMAPGAGGANWQPVPCAALATSDAPALLALDPARPTVKLRTTGSAVALGEDPANVVGAGLAAVSLAAWDVGCGATQLALRIAPSPYRPGRMVLEAEVVDGAGNRRTQAWHIARR